MNTALPVISGSAVQAQTLTTSTGAWSGTAPFTYAYEWRRCDAAGALLGGLIIGVVESLCGLYLGESLGQIGIFVIFILVLLFRPSGLFGERA